MTSPLSSMFVRLCTLSAVKLDGHSMSKVIADPKSASDHEVLHFGWANVSAVRKGDWKLIANQNKTTGMIIKASLHNLIDTEPEVKDYALERPDLVSELTALHRMLEMDFASK